MNAIPPGTDLNTIPIFAPPQGQISNLIDPPTLAPVVDAICSLLIFIEVFFVGVRVYSNLRAGHKLSWDGICAIIATILTFGLIFCLLYLRPLARHGWDISVGQLNPSTVKVIFAQEMILGPTIFASKSSLLLLYYRVFSHNKYMRYNIYGGLIFCGATQLIMIPIDAALCAPGIGQPWRVQVKCERSLAYGLVQGPSNVILDIFLLILPMRPIWKLNLPLKKKVGVLAIVMTGTLAIIASIVGLVYRIRMYRSSDLSWSSAIVPICALVESSISIICSSMPAMTTFSKLHMAQFSALASLRSRLWSIGKSRSSHSSQGSESQKSYPLSAEAGSSSRRLYGNGYVGLDDFGRSQTTTEIKGVPSKTELEYDGIQKSVRVEQSSDIISDGHRRG